MVLTGTVELDKESMDTLREQIRKEFIEEVKNNEFALYHSEVCDALTTTMSLCEYYAIIEVTINKVLESIDKNDLAFNSDKIKYTKLKLIKNIIEL